MDLAQFAGDDFVDLEIAGRAFRVGELTLRDWAPVQAWIKAHVPGPLSSLGSPDFKKLPGDVKRDVLAEALEQDRTSWPPRIGSQSWFLAMDVEGGHAELLLALLGKCQPVDRAEALAIAEAISFEQILPAVLAGLGLFGPKSPAPAATAPATPTTSAAGATSPTTSATSPTRSRRPGAGRGTTSSA
jgi:hypothetical protein